MQPYIGIEKDKMMQKNMIEFGSLLVTPYPQREPQLTVLQVSFHAFTHWYLCLNKHTHKKTAFIEIHVNTWRLKA